MVLVVVGYVAALALGLALGLAVGRRVGPQRRRDADGIPQGQRPRQAERVARWLAPPPPVAWDDDSAFALVSAFESAVVRHTQFKAQVAYGTEDEAPAYATAHALAARVGGWRDQLVRALDDPTDDLLLDAAEA